MWSQKTQKLNNSTVGNSEEFKTPSRYASRPFDIQEQSASTQQQQEDAAFAEQKMEATRLEIQAKHGTITPEGQERLTLLQAQMHGLLQARCEHGAKYGHSLERIAFRRPDSAPPVQAKLTIGQPGDKYEQEADETATQVVQRIHQPLKQPVQREAVTEEELQTKPVNNIQRQELSDDEELQMKPMVQRLADGGMAASADVEAGIQSAKGGGQPLADSIREPMEQAFGADFGGVRIHTDATSDKLNKSIQARAFTTGQDIFFRQGEYSPQSNVGKELLAHELTHVVQQSGGAVQPKVLHSAPKENKIYSKETAESGQLLQTREEVQPTSDDSHEQVQLQASSGKTGNLVAPEQGSNQNQIKDYFYWFKVGLDALDRKQWQEAFDAFNEAIKLNPNDAASWNNKGVALDRMNNYTEALKCFQKSLQINPSSRLYQSNLQIILDKSSENSKKGFVSELDSNFKTLKAKINTLNLQLQKNPTIDFTQDLWERFSSSSLQLSRIISDAAANFNIKLDPDNINITFEKVVNSLAAPVAGVVVVGIAPLSGFLTLLGILVEVLIGLLVIAAVIAILYAIYIILKTITDTIQEAIKRQQENKPGESNQPNNSNEPKAPPLGEPDDNSDPTKPPKGRGEEPNVKVNFYHGTDESTANKLKGGTRVEPIGKGEFGQGFYTFIEQEPAELVAEQYTRNRRPPLPRWGVVNFIVPINVLIDYFGVGAIDDLISGNTGNILYFPDKDTTLVEVSYPDDVYPGVKENLTWKEFVNKNREFRRTRGSDVSWPYDLIVGPLSGRIPGYRDINQFMFNDYGVYMLNDRKVERQVVARGDTGA